jgi:transcriptional regulator with XRE-family HTH domain
LVEQDHFGRRNSDMIDGPHLKRKRTLAGIAGDVLCLKIGIPRSRLSNIERGYTFVPQADIERINTALDELIQTKSALDQIAASLGWPQGAHRD